MEKLEKKALKVWAKPSGQHLKDSHTLSILGAK